MLTLLSTVVALRPAPRLVFTDCDGTMLNPDHQLSPASSAMLHTLADRGVRVVPATGRARAGSWTTTVLDAHPVLKNGNPGVYVNGCCAFDEDGTQLASTFVPEADVERVRQWWLTSGATTGTALVAYIGGEALYVPGQRPDAEERLVAGIAELGDSPPRGVDEVTAAETAETFKLMFACDDDPAAKALIPLVRPLLGEGTTLLQAIPGMLEIVPASASKATACAVLLERWGLKWDEVLAIGDGGNDLPMLKAAGTSVAMGNGGEAVKAAAQHVVGTNGEDGWAEAMQRYVLDRL